jgi:hypothetical protein
LRSDLGGSGDEHTDQVVATRERERRRVRDDHHTTPRRGLVDGLADQGSESVALRELPTHYDLVLNTESLEPDIAAEIIARAAGS